VHFKLTNYSRLKVALKDERTTAVDLRDQILELKNTGNEFDFAWFKDEYERRKSRKKSRKVEGLKPKYYCLVVLPLVLFSLIILASCFFVLCGPGSSKPT
jgi:lipopolysaccharide export LptBFGC system permease protein LptF